ncbi:U-box domain-containing protein 35-like [Dioscorea cayenensis subsp. rotundata]|uniref:U-box domain-containing protein 35-like n=1 Tax=Dioscorea cayennensis subsp. rotundata TaxID=55577 RepID=A0AB40BGF2_DIOCR|nr:U-box domain-containing protein 35-like [Dioscorea cayenensis subsp. rotundata]
MPKGLGHWKGSGNGIGDVAGGGDRQEIVAVAVDADKNSQHALKWAADHVIQRGQIFILLHVRKKILTIPTPAGFQVPIAEVDKEIAAAFYEQMDARTKELLLPFQCFCSRRGLQSKEVILEDTDIPKAIIDFLCQQSIDKLVMGASARNVFARTFKAADVPLSVSRLAPDFCSIYVISKGKISSIRPTTHPNSHPPNRAALGFEAVENRFLSIKSEPDAVHHSEPAARSLGGRPTNVKDSGYNNKSNENIIARVSKTHLDHFYPSVASCPSPSRTSVESQPKYPRIDIDRQSRLDEQMRVPDSNKSDNSYWSSGSSSSGYNNHSGSASSEEHKSPTSLPKQMSNYKNGERANMPMKSNSNENRRPQALHEGLAEERKLVTESNKGVPSDKSPHRGIPEEIKMLNCFSSDVRYRRYTAEEIRMATGNFSDELKVGEGGYGPVFKSYLDHTPVAIKILGSDVSQGMKQFQREVEVLSSIRHPNMVLLMGACPEYGCLVYEYMSNGSLEDRLFCLSNTAPLPWRLRFKIASEIATGLHFLHQAKPEPIVHRDLKPGNILLDHNFVSKIADVGLARLIPHTTASDSATQYHMTAAAGTFCYIDPEYQKTGMLGIKSDIYALGIILLQLITAATPVGLAHNVEMAIERGKFEEVLDHSVPDWPLEETRKFADLALKCAELRRRDRPSLASVILPELNHLRALAESSSEETNWVQHHERSLSYKVT